MRQEIRSNQRLTYCQKLESIITTQGNTVEVVNGLRELGHTRGQGEVQEFGGHVYSQDRSEISSGGERKTTLMIISSGTAGAVGVAAFELGAPGRCVPERGASALGCCVSRLGAASASR